MAWVFFRFRRSAGRTNKRRVDVRLDGELDRALEDRIADLRSSTRRNGTRLSEGVRRGSAGDKERLKIDTVVLAGNCA